MSREVTITATQARVRKQLGSEALRRMKDACYMHGRNRACVIRAILEANEADVLEALKLCRLTAVRISEQYAMAARNGNAAEADRQIAELVAVVTEYDERYGIEGIPVSGIVDEL